MKKGSYRCQVDVYSGYKSKRSLLTQVMNSRNPKDAEDAFFIGDLGDVVHKYRGWKETLPSVEPFYAVKCNDHPAILKTLADLGCNFDCASKFEMERVLKLGVSPNRIIFANPVKQVSFIRYALQRGVDLMTFDNETELYKIRSHYPNARLILRILPPSNFKVQCELGMKFGCVISKARQLLLVAKQLSLNIVGISFHVGSGCEDASAFEAAIREASDVYNAAADLGHNVHILDIGGGFPGQNSAPVPFVKIADVVKDSVTRYFPTDGSVRIIAEPGRYFVASAFTLAVNIIAKRVVARDSEANVKGKDKGAIEDEACQVTANDDPSFMYYINDGVYGSFNCILYDHAKVTAQVLTGGDHDNDMLHTCSIWGPTCDGLDCVTTDCLLPDLAVGDWLYFEDMGAYTMCAASTFNGMPRSRCYFLVSDYLWCHQGSGGHPMDVCKCPGVASSYPRDLDQFASVES